MLLDEGTCLFNFDPQQVSVHNKSFVFRLFIMLHIINLFMKHVHGVH